MLCARRKTDGHPATANSAKRSDGPFLCPQCGEVVVLRTGSVRDTHFAHKRTSTCAYGKGESAEHRRCKLAIYEALLQAPGVTDVALERPFGTNRPDVFARIRGVPVAIEVQISAISMAKIISRTEEYARKGIYVLWLPQWTPYLDGVRYAPRLWEKWLHAAYFGRVYYWLEGSKLVGYRFEPHLKQVPLNSWYADNGQRRTTGGYSKRSKRHRSPVRGRTCNLAKDFAPKVRAYWRAQSMIIPSCKLFMEA